MTAIDYLVEQLQKEYKWFPSTQSELIIKAKEMEKKQIFESYEAGKDWETIPYYYNDL